MFRTTIRTAGVVALFASGALLLTGCSSSSTATTASASGSASPSASADRQQAMKAYTDCLSQHGVTLPSGRPTGVRPSGSPGAGGGGYGGGFGGASADPSRKAATQACASLRPQGNGQGRGGGGFNSTAMQAFVSCMKDHGVTVPATGGIRSLNTADPATADAFKICQPLMPARSSADPSSGATAEATTSPTA